MDSEQNYIIELIGISPIQAVDYFLFLNKKSNYNVIEKVFEYLKQISEKCLHVFLHHLHLKDKILSVPYNHYQPRLYAKYNPEWLLKFLKSTQEYSEDEVLKLCSENQMMEETVYILEKKSNK
jgi:hypothetical protein